jgi:hypothetical protein
MAIDGTYNLVTDTPMGKQESTLTLKADGDALIGSTKSMMGEADFSGGKVDGDNFEFMIEAQGPMGKMELTFKGSVSGDDISGEVTTPFGPAKFEGKRT